MEKQIFETKQDSRSHTQLLSKKYRKTYFRNSNQNPKADKTTRDSCSTLSSTWSKWKRKNEKRIFETRIRIDDQWRLCEIVATTLTSIFKKYEKKGVKRFSKDGSEPKNRKAVKTKRDSRTITSRQKIKKIKEIDKRIFESQIRINHQSKPSEIVASTLALTKKEIRKSKKKWKTDFRIPAQNRQSIKA